jgi:alcohol dehydrogenase class IV
MDIDRVTTWHAPTRLVFGLGSSSQAGPELRQLGGSKALLVTDKGVEGAGVLEGILASLKAADIGCAVYNGVVGNPTTSCVEEAAALYRAEGCDCLLAVGGGSSIDTGKIAGGFLASGLSVREMEGTEKVKAPIPPFVAIPTTCGTGSEVNWAGVIVDTERRFKMGIRSVQFFPKVALIDARLLAKLPGPVIASTGMDALCHALESYTTLNNNPICDYLDLGTISIISRWLRPAVANANMEAMSHMVLASTMAGMGFGNTGLTLVHAMSHPVGAHHGVPHGVANAVLLPYVMEFNLIGAPERFAEVARAMGEDTLGLTVREAAKLSVKAVKELARDIGIPESFKSYGMTEEHVEAMVRDSLLSPNIPRNPVRVTREDIAAIFRRAM